MNSREKVERLSLEPPFFFFFPQYIYIIHIHVCIIIIYNIYRLMSL
jgi:hypothetical protein